MKEAYKIVGGVKEFQLVPEQQIEYFASAETPYGKWVFQFNFQRELLDERFVSLN